MLTLVPSGNGKAYLAFVSSSAGISLDRASPTAGASGISGSSVTDISVRTVMLLLRALHRQIWLRCES